MKRSILLTLSLILYLTTSAQYENVWTFGINAGLDFNGGAPVPLLLTAIKTWEGCATVCDESGKLLFYTDGTMVFNKNNFIMPNGQNLQPYIGGGQNGTYSTSQGALIVPVPRNYNQYYVFSLVSQDMVRYHKDDKSIGKLYYSIVDMTLNNGLGDVVPSKKGVLVDSFLAEAMTSVKGDDCNVWVLVTTKDGYLRAYDVTAQGISAKPVVSPVSGIYPGNAKYNAYGCMDVSPDRTRLAIAWQNTEDGDSKLGKLGLYRFDVNTGLASDETILNDTLPFYSVCFSPGNSKLYTSLSHIGNDVYQFDLSAGGSSDIINSKELIYASNSRLWGSAMKRGPDGKIYYARSVSYPTVLTGYLSVIQYPELFGAACQFVDTGVTLSYYTFAQRGLPNVISIPENKNILSQGTKTINACFAPNADLVIDKDSSTNFVWSTGDTDSAISVQTSGTYWVKYKVFCDTYIDTFRVTIFNPLLNTANSCINAANGKAWLTWEAPFESDYQTTWCNENKDTLSLKDSVDDLGVGTYFLYITSASGCDTVLQFYIEAMDYQVSFTSSDTLICVGENIQFTNTSHPHFSTFHWSFGDGDTADILNTEHSFSEPGSYKVMLIGLGALCLDTAYQSVSVDAQIEDLRFDKDKEFICVGERVRFTTDIQDSTLIDLNWKLGDGFNVNEGGNTVSHAYDSAGTIYIQLTATSRACADISFTDSISVHPFPVVYLGPDSVMCLNGSPIILQNNLPHFEGYRYKWSTGATTQQLRVDYPGEYRLTVTNEYDCASTETITVNRDCYMAIPNVFSPNGDGVNDYFFPRQFLSKSITAFRMQIFNRWGVLVFETDKTDGRGWDGRFNNRDQPQGVYVYIVDAIINNNENVRKQGNVTLIR